jgi:cellulose synthase/poly-beta-1,6-N-acetylglucosamine synthase-like glycosyltransferase
MDMSPIGTLVLQTILILAATAVLVLSALLLLEALAALLPVKPLTIGSRQPLPSVVILMPAHDEALGIRATLEPILRDLPANYQLVVVADNCTDPTANFARAAGATVLERQDPGLRGKGYAMDFGLRTLEAQMAPPPDVVIFLDADCEISQASLDLLVSQAMSTGRPIQAVYLMGSPPKPNPKHLVSAFAFKVKNLVRPLGLSRFGLPSMLTGTGMAFPWQAIRSVNVASGHLVEDMKLGMDLAIAGYPVKFCPQALVTSVLPQQDQASTSQRTRWEHGHMQSLLSYGPELLKNGLVQGRPALVVLALDLCIPPLSLLVMLWAGMTTLCLGAGLLTGGWLPFGLAAAAGASIVTAILLSWARFAQADLPLQQLVSIPLYMLGKVPLYFRFLTKRQQTWERTERDGKPNEL